MRILSVFLFVVAAFATQAQNAPVDFEPNGIGQSWNWKVFQNGSNPPVEFVPNPDPDPNGYNPSPTVAKFSALSQGAPFAGCETQHGTDIGTFTIDNSNKIIRVMVYKNTISDVGIKLVRFDNWSLGEIKVANTKINEWEQLEFDFSDHFGLTYDQLVFFRIFAVEAKQKSFTSTTSSASSTRLSHRRQTLPRWSSLRFSATTMTG